MEAEGMCNNTGIVCRNWLKKIKQVEKLHLSCQRMKQNEVLRFFTWHLLKIFINFIRIYMIRDIKESENNKLKGYLSYPGTE